MLLTIMLFTFPIPPIAGNQADTTKTTGRHLYIKAQYAGNLGLVSAGIGNEFFKRKLSIDLNYGYLPESINGARVHTFAVKAAFLIKKFNVSGIQPACHIGISVNYGIASNTYLRYPGYYPEGSYLPNAIHANPFIRIGAYVPFINKKFDNISIYTELGTVEYKIWYAITNKEVRFYEIWNMCFGLAYHF